MALSDDLSFNEWYDIFQGIVKKAGYTGPLDKYTFEFDYESDVTPEVSAQEFLNENNN